MVKHLEGTKELAKLHRIRRKLETIHKDLAAAKRPSKIMRLEREMEVLVDQTVAIIKELPRPS